MSWLPDDIREASGGEVVDHVAHDVLKMTHQALNRFPEMKKRHMFIAGGAALSSALVVGAGVALVRRLRAGQTPDEAVNGVTEEELEGVMMIERERNRRRRDAEHREAAVQAGDAVADAPLDADVEPTVEVNDVTEPDDAPAASADRPAGSANGSTP